MWYMSIGGFIEELLNKKGSGFQTETIAEMDGVWDITTPTSKEGGPTPILSRVVGSKQKVLELANICFGHPAEPEHGLKWEIHPSKARVNTLDAQNTLYFIKYLAEQLRERIPPPSLEVPTEDN